MIESNFINYNLKDFSLQSKIEIFRAIHSNFKMKINLMYT